MEATLRFELRLDTVNKKGEHPLIFIIRITGQRRKVSKGITLFPELWENENQQIVNLSNRIKNQLGKKYGENLPSKSQLIKYQDQVSAMKSEVRSIESRYIYERIPYSADMIAENLKEQKNQSTKKEDPSHIVFDCYYTGGLFSAKYKVLEVLILDDRI